MFQLVISLTAIIMVVFISLSTVYYADPEKIPEFIALFVGLLVLAIISVYIQYKYHLKKYKKIVELKKKEIKMLRENEIKPYVLNALVNQELYVENVEELLSVLTIGRIKKAELAKCIIEEYKKHLTNETTELATSINDKH